MLEINAYNNFLKDMKSVARSDWTSFFLSFLVLVTPSFMSYDNLFLLFPSLFSHFEPFLKF